MSGQPVYFLEGVDSGFDRVVDEAGLRDRLPTFEHGFGPGPAGKRGTFMAVSGGDLHPTYREKSQTWNGPHGYETTDGSGNRVQRKFWIGFVNDARPEPADLLRPSIVRGRPVKMFDDNEWIIPAARLTPRAIYYNGDGTIHTQAGDRYAWLFDEAARASGIPFDASEKGEPAFFEYEYVLDLSARLLSVNYRVSSDPRQELSLLRLVDSEHWEGVVAALCDLGIEKKKDSHPLTVSP